MMHEQEGLLRLDFGSVNRWFHKQITLLVFVYSSPTNRYVWNVVQTEHFFGLQSKFKYFIVILKYIFLQKTICLYCKNASGCKYVKFGMGVYADVYTRARVIYLTVTPSFSRTRTPFS